MIGLIQFLFMMVFLFSFGRFAVELIFGHRNVFLMKVSFALMVLSGGAFYLMIRLQEWAIDHPGFDSTNLIAGIAFLVVVFVGAGLGFFWMKKLD